MIKFEMKKFGALLVPLLLSACDYTFDDSDILEGSAPTQNGIQACVPSFGYVAEVSRSTIQPTDKGLSFAWREGDQIGVYADNAMANFSIVQLGEDVRTALFDGGGFGLIKDMEYVALYPYMGYATDKRQVHVLYTDQIQRANGDTEHLSTKDFLVARAKASGPNAVSFSFNHLNAVMRIRVMMPWPGRYTHLTVSAADSLFVLEGMVDLTNNIPYVEPLLSSNTIALQLGNEGIDLTADNLELTTYIIVAPRNFLGIDLTITVTDSHGIAYVTQVSGKDMLAGKAYAYSATHTGVDLGLSSGALWATTNVGAEQPAAYGGHYSWGENFERDYYDWSTYSYCHGSNTSMTKYGMNDDWGVNDGRSTLEPQDDTATSLWGSYWRTPTDKECVELVNQCYWAWFDDYRGTGSAGYAVYRAKSAEDKGINGRVVKANSQYSLDDVHIFLPASGSHFASRQYKYNIWGNYWSSNISDIYGYDGLSLSFWADTDLLKASALNYRYYGYSVRPVLSARCY